MELAASDRLFKPSAVIDMEPASFPTASLLPARPTLHTIPTRPDSFPRAARFAESCKSFCFISFTSVFDNLCLQHFPVILPCLSIFSLVNLCILTDKLSKQNSSSLFFTIKKHPWDNISKLLSHRCHVLICCPCRARPHGSPSPAQFVL